MTIKKGDNVVVLAGKDRGKQGTVERVLLKTDRVVVAGINMVKRHLKPTQQNPRGGIIEKPASVHRSNLMIVDPKTKKPTRIKHVVDANGKRYRASVKSGANLDVSE